MELRIKRAPRIDIEITVPGDKSISHRAVIIAALSNGICTLRGFLPNEDCMHTVNAMRALGIKIEQPEPDMLIVHGKKRVLTPPKTDINCGNSGTTMRLLAGLLAGQTFESRLVGDEGLSKHPMDRVIVPLFVRWVQTLLSQKGRTVGAATARRRRLDTWNSLSSARRERAGQECVAPGGPLCQGQDDCRGAVSDAKSYRGAAQLFSRSHGAG